MKKKKKRKTFCGKKREKNISHDIILNRKSLLYGIREKLNPKKEPRNFTKPRKEDISSSLIMMTTEN